MNDPHEHVLETQPPAGLGSRGWVALAVFGGIAAYFLWTEHRAHAIQFLPWVLVALCPLMHLFMHGRHGHRGDRSNSSRGAGERAQMSHDSAYGLWSLVCRSSCARNTPRWIPRVAGARQATGTP